MAISVPPRSVSDATRFTPTTPHAASAAAAGQSLANFATVSSRSAASASSPSRFQPPSRSSQPPRPPGGAPGGRPPPSPASGGAGGKPPVGGETPEQRVARLRAAHLAAKNAQVSRLDQLISRARGLFDSAHRLTIVSLIGFTAVASVITMYTAADMMRYNRQRKLEFQAAQETMEADSLAAARLAFMRGDATPEQTAMVEAARAQEKAAAATGGQDAAFRVPSLLGAPSKVQTDKAAEPAAAAATAAAVAAVAAPSSSSSPSSSSQSSGWGSSVRSWFSSTLSREEQGDVPGSSQRRLGYESLSEEDDSEGVAESDIVRALELKAQQALERERANQRNGGPLDRLGLESNAANTSPAAAASAGESAGSSSTKKSSWW